MRTKMDDLMDDVIQWVSDGSEGMTDYVQQTARFYGVSKAEVRAIINNYDANPGSPAGRPEKAPESLSEAFYEEGSATPQGTDEIAPEAAEELTEGGV